jgi:hypothetical protein
MRMEGLVKLKELNEIIGSQTRDLLACGIMPQPITLERVHHIKL